MSSWKPPQVFYNCAECGGMAFIVHGHIRVSHRVKCRRWIEIQIRFPRLVRMLEQEQREIDTVKGRKGNGG
jgi:hypothetical protein